MYSIRHCEKKDFEQIRQIYAEPGNYSATLQSPYPPFELWEARLSSREAGCHDLVAVKGEEVLGHLGLHGTSNPRRKHTAHIGMAVKTAAHRQGVGSALMSAAIELAEQWQAISRIELSVFTDNHAAQALYAKHHFKQEGLAKNFAFRNGQLADVLMMARCKD